MTKPIGTHLIARRPEDMFFVKVEIGLNRNRLPNRDGNDPDWIGSIVMTCTHDIKDVADFLRNVADELDLAHGGKTSSGGDDA